MRQKLCEESIMTLIFLSLLLFQGLETTRPGQYDSVPSVKILETSDSGGEFVTSPSDTDATIPYASDRPLLNAISPTAVAGAVHYGALEADQIPDSTLSASPTSNHQSLTAVTFNEVTASPETVSRGSTTSDLDKTIGNADQKEGVAQST